LKKPDKVSFRPDEPFIFIYRKNDNRFFPVLGDYLRAVMLRFLNQPAEFVFCILKRPVSSFKHNLFSGGLCKILSSLSRLYGLGASVVNLLFLSVVLFHPEAGIKPHSAPAAFSQPTRRHVLSADTRQTPQPCFFRTGQGQPL
jgi:hypothetical protein